MRRFELAQIILVFVSLGGGTQSVRCEESSRLHREAWQVLEQAAGEFPDAFYVAEGLRANPDDRAVRLLRKMVEKSAVSEVQLRALWALSERDGEPGMGLLRTAYRRESWLLGAKIVEIVGRKQRVEGLPLIRDFIEKAPFAYFGPAFPALVSMGNDAIELAMDLSYHRESRIRANAGWAVGQMSGLQTLEVLRHLAREDRDQEVRRMSPSCIG